MHHASQVHIQAFQYQVGKKRGIERNKSLAISENKADFSRKATSTALATHIMPWKLEVDL